MKNQLKSFILYTCALIAIIYFVLIIALSAAVLIFISMMILPLYFFGLIASIHGPLEPLSHLIGFIYAILS